ncbi:MAG TPA: DUF6582 domain-containing protein [Acidiferrobacterales bacterium]|nr:DUF6582 domain-containing protein [Acidiferrobacterales bacterium]
MALTKEQRDALPASDFAVPRKRALPMHDETHVRMAWNMVDRAKDLTEEERKQARHRILERAHKLRIDTKDWNIQAMRLEAMSLEVPEVKDHPNRMPFKGILTRIDETSDLPLNGSHGRLCIITRKAAEAALPSLLGMAVDMKEGLDGHDPKNKVGLITEATIEGNAIHIAGFFYASDFPQEAKRIQAEKARLGFSHEIQARIENLDAPIWVIAACTFTGAAVLYKDKAAYQTTSLAAKAEETDMSKEILEKLEAMAKQLDATNKEIADMKAEQAKLSEKALKAGSVSHLVKPHADRIRAAADGLEKDGYGLHAERGHVTILRHMADSMEAAANMGQLPHVYQTGDFYRAAAEVKADPETAIALAETAKKIGDLAASVASLTTMVKDQEKARLAAGAAPERKTVSIPAATKTLLAKAGLNVDDGEKLTVEQLDKVLDAGKLPNTKRIEVKHNLLAAGLLEATH